MGHLFQCFETAVLTGKRLQLINIDRFLSPHQIAALESELMQLMKQNGIQVNNNNSNSAERLSAQQHSPKRAAAQARGAFVTGSLL